MTSITADAIDQPGSPSSMAWTVGFMTFFIFGLVSYLLAAWLMSFPIPDVGPECRSASLGCLAALSIHVLHTGVAAPAFFFGIVVVPVAYLATLVSCGVGIARGSSRAASAVVALLLLVPFVWTHVEARRDFDRFDRATLPPSSVSKERVALPLFVEMDYWATPRGMIEDVSNERIRVLARHLPGVRMTVAGRVDDSPYLLVGREMASGPACGPLLTSGGEWKDIGNGVCATPNGRTVSLPKAEEARIVEIRDYPAPPLLMDMVSSGRRFDPDTRRSLPSPGCVETDTGNLFERAMLVVVDAGSGSERTYGAGCVAWPAPWPIPTGAGFATGDSVAFFDADPTTVIASILMNKPTF